MHGRSEAHTASMPHGDEGRGGGGGGGGGWTAGWSEHGVKARTRAGTDITTQT